MPPLSPHQPGSKLIYFIALGEESSRRKSSTIFKSLEITAPGSNPDFQCWPSRLPRTPPPTLTSPEPGSFAWHPRHPRAFPSQAPAFLAPFLPVRALLALQGSSSTLASSGSLFLDGAPRAGPAPDCPSARRLILRTRALADGSGTESGRIPGLVRVHHPGLVRKARDGCAGSAVTPLVAANTRPSAPWPGFPPGGRSGSSQEVA